MSLPDHHKKNFKTLQEAFAHDNVALLQCTDKATGEDVSVLCAVHMEGEEYVFTPFAKLFNNNPYDEVDPPASGEPA